MSKEIIRRIATVYDSNLLIPFMEKCFRHTYAKYNTPENMDKYVCNQYNSEIIRKDLKDENQFFVLIEHSTGIIGYAHIIKKKALNDFNAHDCMEIYRFYIDPELKTKGLGSSLMHHIESIAVVNRIKYLWLGVWEQNQNAIIFYDKMGFKYSGDYAFKLGDDDQNDYILCKELAI